MKRLSSFFVFAFFLAIPIFLLTSYTKGAETSLSDDGAKPQGPSPYLVPTCIEIVNKTTPRTQNGLGGISNYIIISFDYVVWQGSGGLGSYAPNYAGPSTDMNFQVGFEDPNTVPNIPLFRLDHVGLDKYQLTIPEYMYLNTSWAQSNVWYGYMLNILQQKGLITGPISPRPGAHIQINCNSGIVFGELWALNGPANTTIIPPYPTNTINFYYWPTNIPLQCCGKNYGIIDAPISACFKDYPNYVGQYQYVTMEVAGAIGSQYQGTIGSTQNDILYCCLSLNGVQYSPGLEPFSITLLPNGNYLYSYFMSSVVPNTNCYDVVLSTQPFVGLNIINTFSVSPKRMCFCNQG